MVEFARIWRDMPKIVFSRTLERAGWNTTVVRDLVPEEVMELKEQPGGDLVLGGAGLAAAFMRHDLIDEYRLYVHPIVIGQGKPMFPPSEPKSASGSLRPGPSATGSSSSATSPDAHGRR
jgi:dihydrofolate reductase